MKLTQATTMNEDNNKIFLNQIMLFEDEVSLEIKRIVSIIINFEPLNKPGEIFYTKIGTATLEELLDHLGVWYFYDNLMIPDNYLFKSDQGNLVEEMWGCLVRACYKAEVKNGYDLINYFLLKRLAGF